MITERNLKIPIYGFKLKIVIFDDRKEIEEKYPEIDLYVGATLEYHGGCTVIIPADDSATAVHECEHVKNAVWKYIGYKPHQTNDEVDAYLLTYIFTEIRKVVQKHFSLATSC